MLPSPSKKNILISGLPGVGKTTVVIRIAEALVDFHPAGFYTSEMRERGMRQGFELVSLDGKRSLLSHVKLESRYRVGRYGVDIKGFEDFLDMLNFTERVTRLVVIDEIGKMESFSEKFKKLVKGLLDSEKPVIATIAQKGEGFISEIKKRGDVLLFELTQANRVMLGDELARYAKTLLVNRQA